MDFLSLFAVQDTGVLYKQNKNTNITQDAYTKTIDILPPTHTQSTNPTLNPSPTRSPSPQPTPKPNSLCAQDHAYSRHPKEPQIHHSVT